MHLSRYPDSPHEDESITRLALFRLFASLSGRRLCSQAYKCATWVSLNERAATLQTTTPGQAFAGIHSSAFSTPPGRRLLEIWPVPRTPPVMPEVAGFRSPPSPADALWSVLSPPDRKSIPSHPSAVNETDRENPGKFYVKT